MLHLAGAHNTSCNLYHTLCWSESGSQGQLTTEANKAKYLGSSLFICVCLLKGQGGGGGGGGGCCLELNFGFLWTK